MATALAEVVERVTAQVRSIGLDEPESDATLAWDSLTCILVQVEAAGETGLGYTYGDESVDIALWDLKAKLLGVALADLLLRFHEAVPVYGSGGFTSLSDEELAEAAQGLARPAPSQDQGRPRAAA